MVSYKTALVLAIICCVLIHELDQNMIEARKIDCKAKCKHRCSKASRHKMCIRACNTCCHRCHCVPPGTSGHNKECPCYAHMTTHGGKLKCP